MGLLLLVRLPIHLTAMLTTATTAVLAEGCINLNVMHIHSACTAYKELTIESCGGH